MLDDSTTSIHQPLWQAGKLWWTSHNFFPTQISRGSAVCFPAMGNPGDYYLVRAIVHKVQDTVIAHSQTVLVLIPHQLLCSGWPGIRLQTGDGLFNSGTDLCWQAFKVPEGSRANKD
jgi:hypothetical protein